MIEQLETLYPNAGSAINEYSVTIETFDTLSACWRETATVLPWRSLFTLPPWLSAWWHIFGADWKNLICVVRNQHVLIGIAPLMLRNGEAQFIGSPDVCDFMDCIITPGAENVFFKVLITYLQQHRIKRLVLHPVRIDSSVYVHLPKSAQELGCQASCAPNDVVLELSLPATWDEFLSSLSGKQRHEIRRKLRRLEENGRINFWTVNNPDHTKQAMATFISLFRQNRNDKASFMTAQMEQFFCAVASALSAEQMLKLSFLNLNDRPIAAVMCFDYRFVRHLYNNAYDRQFIALSVGLLSKIFSIKDSIEQGLTKYDFLKGAEDYKQRLGGKPGALYTCRVNLK
jgi:CelD/BcsL family acetyltransferase involved in cellulose biosynthesis